MYPLKYTKCTQDDEMDDSNSNYPFASYVNGFVDGLKYASEEDKNTEDNIMVYKLLGVFIVLISIAFIYKKY